MRITGYILLFCFLCFLKGNVKAQALNPSEHLVNASDTFPVPPAHKSQLFYVQRTHNKNTIVYDLNYNADSTINETNPIKIYWIRYSDNGEVAPLSYIQNKYAYGVETVMIDKTKKTFKINFVSYKKRDIILMKSNTDKSYHAFITINGKPAYLAKAFVQIEGGTFWVPHIAHVELTGMDIVTGSTVREKFKP